MPSAEEVYRAVTGHVGPLPEGAESWEAIVRQALHDHGYAATEDLSEVYFLDRIKRSQFNRWMEVHNRRLTSWFTDDEVWPITVQDLQTEATADLRALYTTPAPRAKRLSEARARASESRAQDPARTARRRVTLDERYVPTGSPTRSVPAGFCTELLKLYEGGKSVKEVIKEALEKLNFPANKLGEKEAYVRNRTSKLIRVGAIRRA